MGSTQRAGWTAAGYGGIHGLDDMHYVFASLASMGSTLRAGWIAAGYGGIHGL